MSTKQQGGYTIIELMVTIVAGSILALTVLSISIFFFADVMRARAESELTSEARNINGLVAEDLRLAQSIIDVSTNVDPNNAAGWTTSNANTVLVVAIPATDVNGEFADDPDLGGVYKDELVYFVSDIDNGLYKRRLVNPLFTDNSKLTSCPAAAVSSSCPADILLSEDFSDMTFTFYDQDNSVTLDESLARSITLNIEMVRNSFGVNIEAVNVTRMTMRNPT